MNRSKRYGNLVLTTVMLFLWGCKSSNETILAPQIPPAEPTNACSCSVTCPTPTIEQTMAASPSSEDVEDVLASRTNTITTVNDHKTLGGKNPAYNTKSSILFSVDFLYWKAVMGNLEYAANLMPLDSSGFSFSEQLKKPKFRWDVGFRACLGYRFGMHDNWEIDLQYTLFYNKTKSRVSNPDPSLMVPTWGGLQYFSAASGFFPGIFGFTILKASANWTLHYNIFDVDLGRHYFVTKAFSLRPFISGRVALINQDYDVHYLSVLKSDITDSFSTTLPTSMKAGSDYQGIGPRLGLDMHWHFNCKWSFIGKLSGCLLYGPFKTEQTYDGGVFYSSSVSPTPRTTPTIFRNNKNAHRFQANFESAMGFQWEHRLNQKGRTISLAAFYEIIEWLRLNRLTRDSPTLNTFGSGTNYGIFVVDDPYVKDHGDLNLQGVSIKASLDF